LEEEILAENYEKSAKSLLPPIKSKHKKHASSSMLTKQNSFTTNYTKGTANVTEIDF
jgi:hypothetical protein